MSEFQLSYMAGVEVAALRVGSIPIIGRWLAPWVRKFMD